MTYINDLLQGGYWPLQHHEVDYDVNYRLKRFACRVEGRDERGRYVIEDDTAGDVTGAVLWQTNFKAVGGSSQPGVASPKGTGKKTTIPAVPDKERIIPGWSWAWPSVVTTARKGKLDTVVRGTVGGLGPTAVRPIFGPNGAQDVRYKEKSPEHPSWASKLPKGWTGLTTCASDDDRQLELLHADFLGCVAVNNNGDAERSTKVFDLLTDNGIDSKRSAHLHSMMRVVRPNDGIIPFNGNGLAWQLGRGGRDQLGGWGLVIDNAGTPESSDTSEDQPGADNGVTGATIPRNHGRGAGFAPTTTTPRDDDGDDVGGTVANSTDGAVIGCGSSNASGPFEVGSANDQHRISTSKDGQPINALHLSTNSLFRGNGGDCPIEFGSRYIAPGPGSRMKRAHLRFDPLSWHEWIGGSAQGLWRFLAESDTYVVQDPKQPGPKGPKPTGPTGPTGPAGPGPTGPTEPTGPTAPRPWQPHDDWLPPIRLQPTTPSRLHRDLASGHQSYCATTMNFAVPALLIRPPLREVPKGEDLRQSVTQNIFHQQDHDNLAPITMRIDGYAAQGRGGTVYTEQPSKGRWRGGTSDGGVVFLPPEMDLEDIEKFDGDPPRMELSSIHIVAKPDHVRFAAALPDLATGGVKSGFTWRGITVGSNTDLVWESVDGEGTATERMRITSDGYVAIGHDSPTSALHVQGDVNLQAEQIGFYGESPVPQDGPWTVGTHTTERDIPDSGAGDATLETLYNVVNTLCDVLKTNGLLG